MALLSRRTRHQKAETSLSYAHQLIHGARALLEDADVHNEAARIRHRAAIDYHASRVDDTIVRGAEISATLNQLEHVARVNA